MKSKFVILFCCLTILGCEIICIQAASFTTTNSSDECSKETEAKCQESNLFCCAKLNNQCCSEEEYYNQVRTKKLPKYVHFSEMCNKMNEILNVNFLAL